MADELVYRVEGHVAYPAEAISLAQAGLKERAHLQEWVIAQPEMLGDDVLIVTAEFDRWTSRAGTAPLDRLDVLGLGPDGRLVVAELKRDAAPDTVEMQAVKYAAMASRFTPEDLAAAYTDFCRQRDETISEAEALERLNAHAAFSLSAETLRTPRIVLVASSFPAVVTASVVWLSEMGLDISLVQVQAYRTGEHIIITVSPIYPVKDVEEFTVAPTKSARLTTTAGDLGDIDWTPEDMARLRSVATNATVIAMIDLGAEHPGEWISLPAIRERADRTQFQARGDLAGLTMMLKHRFGRRNWPMEARWGAGGAPELVYYRLPPHLAYGWVGAEEGGGEPSEPPLVIGQPPSNGDTVRGDETTNLADALGVEAP